MEYLQLQDKTIAYRKQGHGDPLVLLHGFPTSSYLFHAMLAPLAEHYTVYAPDLMGFGQSRVDSSIPVDIAEQAVMVGDFADALNLKPFTLVGHDIGGGIAQLIAVHHPDWLQKLVLMNCTVGDNFPIPRVQALINALKVPAMKALIRITPLLDWWAGSSTGIKAGVVNKSVMDNRAINEFIYHPFASSMDGMERLFRIVEAQTENGDISRRVFPKLHHITTPTLILWGEQDAFLGLQYARQLMQAIPTAKAFHIIPDTGHFCPLEKPDLIASYIVDFGKDR